MLTPEDLQLTARLNEDTIQAIQNSIADIDRQIQELTQRRNGFTGDLLRFLASKDELDSAFARLKDSAEC